MKKNLDYQFADGGLTTTHTTTHRDFSVSGETGDKFVKPIIECVSAEETRELWDSAARGVWHEDYEKDGQGNYILDDDGNRIGKGSSVEYAILRPDAEGPLGVEFMGLGGDLNPVSEREAAAILKSMGTSLGPLLIINNPGSGKSSPLPPSVIKRMKKEKSFIPQGEYYADIIGSKIQELAGGRGIEILGHSLGANTALGFTAAYFAATRNQVDGLRLIAPLGTEHHTLPDTYMRFVIIEGIRASQYSKQSLYNELDELKVKKSIAGTTNRNWISTMISSLRTVKQNFWDFPVVAGRESLESDLRQALPAISRDLTVVSPEQSKFGNSETTKQILARLALMSNRPDSITHYEVSNHSLAAISAGAGARVLGSMYGIDGIEK
jgi:pimeloyl-ACP methyl ester carboxylesterase